MNIKPLPAADWKGPAALLFATATFLPEVASGNTPLSHYLSPAVFIFLALAYGLALLVIREFAARHQVNLFGLFLLGLAYGLVNEGLMAKTIKLQIGVPIPAYDNYGYALGTNFAWAFAICLWHALHSVIFPILLANFMFPAAAGQPWFSKPVTTGATALLLALASLVFFSSDRGTGSPIQFAALLATIAMLAMAATRFKLRPVASESAVTSRWRFWLAGLSTCPLFYILLTTIAEHKWPLPIFFAAVLAEMAALAYLLHRASQTQALLFAAAAYQATTALGIVAGFIGAGESLHRLLVGILIEILFALLMWKLLKVPTSQSSVVEERPQLP